MIKISLKNLIKHRRALHSIPELGYQEYETQKYIIDNLPINIYEINKVGTGVVAYYDLKKSKTIALRSDMDALPIKEKNDVPYKSLNKNMHACGHDGHMAMLLEVARILPSIEYLLQTNVLLIFQPAEELSKGSQKLYEEGLKGKYQIDEIYALHLWPFLKENIVYCKKNTLLAGSAEISIDIYGNAAHVGSFNLGSDTIISSVKLINALNTKKINSSMIFKINCINSGKVRNVISDFANLEGTYRFTELKQLNKLISKANKIIKKIEQEEKVKIKFKVRPTNNPVIQNTMLFNRHKDKFDIVKKIYFQSEDFSYYLKHYKGLFCLLGCNSKYPLHHDKFNFDEQTLLHGVKFYLSVLVHQ